MGTLIADFVKSLFVSILDALNENVDYIIEYCLQNPFDSSSSMYFSWINTVIGYIQVVAFGVALAIRLFGAAKEGLLSSFRAEPYLAAEWLFETIWVLALICAAPSICIFFTGFTMDIAHDICGIADGATLFDSFADTITSNIDNGEASGLGTGFAAILIYVIMSCMMIYYVMSVTLQCLKRLILIVFLSIVLPIALCADSTRDTEFTRAAGCVEVIIYSGLLSALQIIMLESAFGIVLSLTAEIDMFFIWACIGTAMFAAIKSLPEWLDKYLPGPIAAGRAGSKIGTLGTGLALRRLAGASKAAPAAAAATVAK